MYFMEFFSKFSRHCRNGFNFISERCASEKAKWKKNSKTIRSSLPNIVNSIFTRKWKDNVLIKYFRSRKKLQKTDITEEEKLETIAVNNLCAELPVPQPFTSDEAWKSIFVDLTKKGSMTYLIFVDQKTLYPEVFELGVRSLWKQTKRAFRDVFREYRIPVEIHTSEKVFFDSGKFVRFMKDHGISTATKSDAKHNLANVLASVKVLIHNSRFWHEELRKLRESISKSLLATEDKYVQVNDGCEDDAKFTLSDSSSDDSSETFGLVEGKYQNQKKQFPNEITAIEPVLITKSKQSYDKKDAMADLITIDEQGFDWMQCLKSISISSAKCSKNRFLKNKIKSTIVNIRKYPTQMSLTRNVTTIHHCSIDQNVSVPGIWKRAKNKLKKKIKIHSNHEEETLHDEYDEMLNYLSRSNCNENNSNDENIESVNFSESNELVLKQNKNDSGDNCSVNSNITTITKIDETDAPFKENCLIRFPIELLPYKYDNLFISHRDLNWKAVVVDVIEHKSKCYYMFIDCATKFPELFLQIENRGEVNVKFLIRALCQLWQIHGKPIEIHSPKGRVFSCTELCRFIEKYDMFFYYDSPFLRNDMKIGHIWMEYKNILGNGNTYTELLRIQRKIRKMTKLKEKREADKKRQKTLYSLNKTITDDATCSLELKPADGILQKETIDFIEHISWRKIVVDEIHHNECNYLVFIDIETFCPHIMEIKYTSKLHSATLLIKTFRNFFNKKKTSEEVHVEDKYPFNIQGVIGFMDRIGVSYYRQSRYLNGGSCVYKCLEHIKSLVCESTDLSSAVSNYKNKPLPWLGLSPQQLSCGHQMNPLFDCTEPPWADIIVDIFSHEGVGYLIIFDYESLYPEIFHLGRRYFTKTSFKIIKACESAFSVVGCPSKLWTFDREFAKSDSFLKFLQTRCIMQFYLTPQKERETSSMLASFRQKLSLRGSLVSALVSTREAYNHFIGACPVRKLREKETALSEAHQAAIHQKKHVTFNLPEISINGIDRSDSDEQLDSALCT